MPTRLSLEHTVPIKLETASSPGFAWLSGNKILLSALHISFFKWRSQTLDRIYDTVGSQYTRLKISIKQSRPALELSHQPHRRGNLDPRYTTVVCLACLQTDNKYDTLLEAETLAYVALIPLLCHPTKLPVVTRSEHTGFCSAALTHSVCSPPSFATDFLMLLPNPAPHTLTQSVRSPLSFATNFF